MTRHDIDLARLHRLEENARRIARMLDDALHHAGPIAPGRERMGFALLLFSFDGPELTWISNADRGDMLKALGEFMAKAEADRLDELSRPKGSG